MKKLILLLIVVGTLFGCNNRSKSRYKYTIKRDSTLYIEVYKTGILGSLTSEYLKDSTNFRVYLGTFDDENGYIYCKLKGDNIYVEQRARGKGSSPQWDTLKVVSRTTYSLKDLKQKKKFE